MLPNPSNFCNIPWFELHVNHDGSYDLCGCMSEVITGTALAEQWNIRHLPLTEYWNSQRLRDLRLQKLGPEPHPACGVCQHQEALGSHSKRIKENLKSVIFYDRFERSFPQSPHRALFEHSHQNDGYAMNRPLSYHVSLGNECDQACVMCGPELSYRLARDYQALGWRSEARKMNWTDDQDVWDRFCQDLLATPDLLSFHIIGGEPMISRRFKELIDLLIDNDKTNLSFSFTTNCMHPIDDLFVKLSRFARVEIGLSIETVTQSNDYVRFGSNINTVISNIQRWKTTAPANVAFVIRTVPTVLTITQYDQLIKWCYDNGFIMDSYFAVSPPWQVIGLLPRSIREQLRPKFQSLLLELRAQQHTPNNQPRNFRDSTQILEACIQETESALRSLDAPDYSDKSRLAVEKFQQLDRLRKQDVRLHFPLLRDWFDQNGYEH